MRVTSDIGKITLDTKSRDDIPALTVGLRAVYRDEWPPPLQGAVSRR